MNATEALQQREDNYELASANRKLTTVVMGMTLLMGLVACLSYLAGRAVTQMKTAEIASVAAPRPQIAVVVPSPAQTIAAPVVAASPAMVTLPAPVTTVSVVETPASPAPAIPAVAASPLLAAAATPNKPQTASNNSAAPAVVITKSDKPSPTAPLPTANATTDTWSGTFLQVGVIDPGRSESFTAPLKAKGYKVQLSPAGSGLRVLIGPMANDSERQQTQAALSADGFPSFPKRL